MWHDLAVSLLTIPTPGALELFCKARGISRLCLFGSAGRADFNRQSSDVDLLVEYQEGRHPGLNHFAIAEELSAMFGRKVDLNTPAMLGRLLPAISREAETLYVEA